MKGTSPRRTLFDFLYLACCLYPDISNHTPSIMNKVNSWLKGMYCSTAPNGMANDWNNCLNQQLFTPFTPFTFFLYPFAVSPFGVKGYSREWLCNTRSHWNRYLPLRARSTPNPITVLKMVRHRTRTLSSRCSGGLYTVTGDGRKLWVLLVEESVSQ